MFSTANGTVSARIREFEYSGSLVRDAEKAKRLQEFAKAALLDEGGTHLIWNSAAPPSPRPPGASWFRQVEKRIAESSTPDPNLARSGRWLPQATAIAALKFFEATSDLLPGEPYIYGSPLGDLVAEFDGERGTLTSVIGPNVTLLFAIVGGTPIKKTVSQESGESELRSELKNLAETLRTGKHGALDTER
jgi:hypothetical protein